MALGGARAGAGRKKGTKNKANQAIADKLKELGCDPIEGMAIIANESMIEARTADGFRDKKEAYKLAGDMYKELAQYQSPKLRSIEVTGEDGGAIKTESTWVVEPVKPLNAE